MDYFEGLIRTLMERENFWTRQSHKVNLTKEEKRAIGKPSIPRPEIDLLLFDKVCNEVIALEAKSYLDSPGVSLDELKESHEIPAGRYKLFPCQNYREIVFSRLKQDLLTSRLADETTSIRLGLAAGNVHKKQEDKVRQLCDSRNWFFLGPSQIKKRVVAFAGEPYENDPFVISAKIALR